MERAYAGTSGQNIIGGTSGVNADNTLAGLPGQIKQNGGFWNEQMTLSEKQLQASVEYCRQQDGEAVNLFALVGLDFLAWFQNTITDKYLVQTGELNLFGGKKIEGLNVVTYPYLGGTITFHVYNGFNDEKWFPAYSVAYPNQRKMKSSCLLLNTNPVNTMMDGTQPFITRYCYGDGASMKDAQLIAVPRGIDANGNTITNAPTNANKSCYWDIQSFNTVLLNDPTRHSYIGIY